MDLNDIEGGGTHGQFLDDLNGPIGSFEVPFKIPFQILNMVGIVLILSVSIV
jgi:hypothetical protein